MKAVEKPPPKETTKELKQRVKRIGLYKAVKIMDRNWMKHGQIGNLLAAVDFTAHPEQNHALMEVLVQLTTAGKEAITTLRSMNKEDIESKSFNHEFAQGTLARIAANIEDLPSDYSSLVQAMIQDSLAPLKDSLPSTEAG